MSNSLALIWSFGVCSKNASIFKVARLFSIQLTDNVPTSVSGELSNAMCALTRAHYTAKQCHKCAALSLENMLNECCSENMLNQSWKMPGSWWLSRDNAVAGIASWSEAQQNLTPKVKFLLICVLPGNRVYASSSEGMGSLSYGTSEAKCWVCILSLKAVSWQRLINISSLGFEGKIWRQKY